MTGRVDAVVVAYRSEDRIVACLAALRAVDGIAGLVVVDHGDGQSAIAAAAAGADTMHDASNPGFGAGQNHGAARGSAPYLLLCNPDAVVDATAVATGVDLLDAHPEVAAVQGAIVNVRTGGLERSQGRELGALHLLARALRLRNLLRLGAVRALARRVPTVADHADRAPLHPVDVESLAATALLIRRAAFEQVHGFATGYFLYGEDLDLCRRLRAAGWRLVALPDRWATHDNGASAATTHERELTWWNGTMTFAARWWGRSAWCGAVAASTLECAHQTALKPRDARRTVRALLLDPLNERRRRAAPLEI
ncbi:MAG TPA: glycosyltransferase [Candidatus Angelobacter sp.]|jgi:N-acetylglucosaminyl-diphospho-decaprenol L-rhamnosyltransferase|nr:glycosyltransferase [Candidatus Angelobacter sp.]